MQKLIDLSDLHDPGGDPRVHGKKLKEIGKYVMMGSILAVAAGYYFYFEGRWYVRDLRLAVALGVSLTLVVGQLIQLLGLHTRLAIVLWIVVLLSGNAFNAGGLRDSEQGVVLLSISGTLLLISATMVMKGNVLLKIYL